MSDCSLTWGGPVLCNCEWALDRLGSQSVRRWMIVLPCVHETGNGVLGWRLGCDFDLKIPDLASCFVLSVPAGFPS
jgi:hypothetical protein